MKIYLILILLLIITDSCALVKNEELAWDFKIVNSIMGNPDTLREIVKNKNNFVLQHSVNFIRDDDYVKNIEEFSKNVTSFSK